MYMNKKLKDSAVPLLNLPSASLYPMSTQTEDPKIEIIKDSTTRGVQQEVDVATAGVCNAVIPSSTGASQKKLTDHTPRKRELGIQVTSCTKKLKLIEDSKSADMTREQFFQGCDKFSPNNDSSDGDQDMEDDDERFGAIIAAELRSIDDPEEKETVIAAIKKVLHESRVRRRQKKQTEIEFKHESEPKPVVSVPRPIDDRTEEEKAVSSIKSEPDEPINDEIPPTDEPTPNLDCKTKTPIPMPMDDRTEEQIAVEAIKEEPVDPSYLGDSSSAFSHSEPDPLCDPAAPQPVTDITEADAAVAAIKQEPAETYEIKISDVNMGDV
ncbi:nucleolar protein dao-5-like isoform X2 [Aricia agestis]|uniref:nucleolar protein dao-5-like isoform X2 n=1 Tax=Aricia agestis TaxID=91739 RepID=UPI001C2031B3|nr:nucleolar protein dao-5-like isoform X2 [Aricia agestis]XP_041982547.1 nucleolar protein dao-5-like isoform X2 [Aricia agestis]